MATTQKKSSSGTRSTQKKTGGRAKSKQPPIRREVAAIVCLLLGMCVLVSNFSADGWLIARVPKTLKGLLGPGFFLTVPALLGVSWVQWTHRGRPVALRTACLLLVQRTWLLERGILFYPGILYEDALFCMACFLYGER